MIFLLLLHSSKHNIFLISRSEHKNNEEKARQGPVVHEMDDSETFFNLNHFFIFNIRICEFELKFLKGLIRVGELC